MQDEGEGPNAAINRLEKALERIARLTAARSTSQIKDAVNSNGLELRVHEAAEQLDALIDRLRIHIFEQRY